jgi:formyltetrahydrofolate deformylase
LATLTAGFQAVASNWEMSFTLNAAPWKPRTAILCSKHLHCVADLLSRTTYGDLGLDVAAVVSNHANATPLANSFGLPFYHVPVGEGPNARAEQEDTLSNLLASLDVELVVLARYMMVLPPELVAPWEGRMINIHHSFLPAFIGANPYSQAQDVAHVSHRDDVAELTRTGRDLETVVLARAVRAHVEHRVLVFGNRTIVFS